MGWYVDTQIDWTEFGDIVVGGNQQVTYWFSWIFDERHWQRMSLTPIGQGRITILQEWVTHEFSQDKFGSHDVVKLWVLFRNDYDEAVTVRPSALVAPSRYPR